MNYPSGSKPKRQSDPIIAKKGKSLHLKVAPGNRGMGFESDLNQSNDYYREKGICLITKRPTPIKVLKVDYTKGAHITSAVYEKQSTTDYNGVYKGHYIDFEAKSTRSKTSFPLANIPHQQIEHLKQVILHQGIAFFLIHFELLNETYFLPAQFVIDFLEEKKRASLPLSFIQEKGCLVNEGYHPRYDYLPLVEKFFLK